MNCACWETSVTSVYIHPYNSCVHFGQNRIQARILISNNMSQTRIDIIPVIKQTFILFYSDKIWTVYIANQQSYIYHGSCKVLLTKSVTNVSLNLNYTYFKITFLTACDCAKQHAKKSLLSLIGRCLNTREVVQEVFWYIYKIQFCFCL